MNNFEVIHGDLSWKKVCYLIFDSNISLYVGSTRNTAYSRIRRHACKPWFKVARNIKIVVEQCSSTDEMLDREVELLHEFRPINVVQHKVTAYGWVWEVASLGEQKAPVRGYMCMCGWEMRLSKPISLLLGAPEDLGI
jgi:predicted GIY-YIG superfamily endonuclease